MTTAKKTGFLICLLASTLAIPGSAAPNRAAPEGPSSGNFCLTPTFYQTPNVLGLHIPRPKSLELSGPSYTVTCGAVAWIDQGTQAYLEDNLDLTTGQTRYVIFFNQALYNKTSGTIQMQGNVRVTTYRAGTAQPTIDTGDNGVVTLGAAQGVPQITLHTVPPQEQYHIHR